MATHGSKERLDLHHRLVRCVRCGHRSEELLAPDTEECPSCGCNLHARPPRSYAEMEGLDQAPALPDIDHGVQDRLDAAATRWVMLLCAVAAVAMATVVGAMLFSV